MSKNSNKTQRRMGVEIKPFFVVDQGNSIFSRSNSLKLLACYRIKTKQRERKICNNFGECKEKFLMIICKMIIQPFDIVSRNINASYKNTFHIK